MGADSDKNKTGSGGFRGPIPGKSEAFLLSPPTAADMLGLIAAMKNATVVISGGVGGGGDFTFSPTNLILSINIAPPQVQAVFVAIENGTARAKQGLFYASSITDFNG